MRRVFLRAALVLPLVAITLSGCADQSPTRPIRSSRPELNVVGAPAWVTLKKYGPAGITYTFDLTIGTGIFPAGDPASVAIPGMMGTSGQSLWTKIWEANNQLAAAANLVVLEVAPPGMKLDSAWITPFARNAGGTFTEENNYKVVASGNSITVEGVSWNRGAYVSLYNSEVPDEGGGEGCTPGYWKQPQHFDSWTSTGYSPNQLFSSVFENAFPGMTLVQVLEQGGGGLYALGRHTVAALLNGASPAVEFELSAAQVISQFNGVFPGGDYEGLKNDFAYLNERYCPQN